MDQAHPGIPNALENATQSQDISYCSQHHRMAYLLDHKHNIQGVSS